MDSYDAIVLGGSLDGLTAACVCARAGLRTVLLERGSALGGVFREIDLLDGLPVPWLRHDPEAYPAALAVDLGLDRFGLDMVEAPGTVSLGPAGPLVLPSDPLTARRVVARLSPRDAVALETLAQELSRHGAAVAPVLTRSPETLMRRLRPAIRALSGDAAAAATWGLLLAGARDGLARTLRHPGLVDHLAALGLGATGEGVETAGGFGLLVLQAAAGRAPGRVARPLGGAAALIGALAAHLRAHGGEIRLGADVLSVLLKGRRAEGVALTAGGSLKAPLVISGLDARRTLLALTDNSRLTPALVEAVRRDRAAGTLAKVLLAVEGAPEIAGVPPAMLSGPIVLHPGGAALAEAHRPQEQPRATPWADVRIPALEAGPGARRDLHALSAVLHGVPAVPAGGTWSAEAREALAASLVKALAPHMPGLPGRVRAVRVVTGSDVEAEERLPGGDWLGGGLAPDRMLWNRPVPDLCGYATPIAGLYLCGEGCHPGPLMPGQSGANAARLAMARAGRRAP